MKLEQICANYKIAIEEIKTYKPYVNLVAVNKAYNTCLNYCYGIRMINQCDTYVPYKSKEK